MKFTAQAAQLAEEAGWQAKTLKPRPGLEISYYVQIFADASDVVRLSRTNFDGWTHSVVADTEVVEAGSAVVSAPLLAAVLSMCDDGFVDVETTDSALVVKTESADAELPLIPSEMPVWPEMTPVGTAKLGGQFARHLSAAQGYRIEPVDPPADGAVTFVDDGFVSTNRYVLLDSNGRKPVLGDVAIDRHATALVLSLLHGDEPLNVAWDEQMVLFAQGYRELRVRRLEQVSPFRTFDIKAATLEDVPVGELTNALRKISGVVDGKVRIVLLVIDDVQKDTARLSIHAGNTVRARRAISTRVTYDGEAFRIGLDARFLLCALSLFDGAELVTIKHDADPVKPIAVTADGFDGETAVVMPVRIPEMETLA